MDMFWQFVLDNKKRDFITNSDEINVDLRFTYQYSTETSTFDAIEKRAESFDFLSVYEEGKTNEMINSHMNLVNELGLTTKGQRNYVPWLG